LLKPLAVFVLFTIPATELFAATPSVVHLPQNVRPLRYRAHLSIDPAQPSFAGSIEIDVSLSATTDTVWLNATDLDVTRALVRSGHSTSTAEIAPQENEFVRLTIRPAVGAGEAWLSLEYRGKLREDSTAGAFRRKSAAGEWYVYSTSTAIDARRIFPSFDQPDYKTPWTLAITAPRGNIALANTGTVSERTEGDRVTVEFAESRPLPSELVAFAVGPFALHDAGKSGSGRTPMRVVAPKGRAAEGKLAAELARTILPRLEEYTAEPYGFGKLDHIALLEGAFGGVENPGLIQYLGRLLLVTPGQEQNRREELEGLMAHEMAHQWFGDLVTQSEWNDVWLSEGITTWMGQKIADLSLPPARRGLRMAASRESAMRIDAGPKARPVRLEMSTRAEMRQVYAHVVYAKGASFVSMLEEWLGQDAMKRVMRRFIRDHRYGTATTADFVTAVRGETGNEIGAISHSLLDRPGVPVVSAALECGGGRPRLRLRQAPYAPVGMAVSGGGEPWTIPVCVRSPDGIDCTVLAEPVGELELKSAKSCPAWVMPDANGSGYYRLDVPLEMLAKLSAVDSLTRVERLTLVEDMGAMVRGGMVQAVEILPLLTRFGDDAELRKAVGDTVSLIGQIVPEASRPAFWQYAKTAIHLDSPAPDGDPADDLLLAKLRAVHGPGLAQFLSRL
jgi:alanyl aminopeptidase